MGNEDKNTAIPRDESQAPSELKAAHDALVAALLDEANQLERWATESRDGGWGTHQVDPMRARAAVLRKIATSK